MDGWQGIQDIIGTRKQRVGKIGLWVRTVDKENLEKLIFEKKIEAQIEELRQENKKLKKQLIVCFAIMLWIMTITVFYLILLSSRVLTHARQRNVQTIHGTRSAR